MNPKVELARRLTQMPGDGLSRDMTEPIMVQMRQVIEARPDSKDFWHLRLMAHWVVHDSLSGDELIFDWLRGLTTAYTALVTPQSDRAASVKAGATILGLDGLRTDVRDLLAREAIRDDLTQDQILWDRFVSGLLGCICDKRIGVPDGPLKYAARQYVDENEALKLPFGYLTGITVFAHEGRFKLTFSSTGKVIPIFRIASTTPFREYVPDGVPDADWTTRVLTIGI